MYYCCIDVMYYLMLIKKLKLHETEMGWEGNC